MKTGQMIGMLVMMGSSLMAQTNVWRVVEKYDGTMRGVSARDYQTLAGWVKGGVPSKGQQIGVGKTSGRMLAPSAFRIRQKDITGEIEALKVFRVPESAQGQNVVVEGYIGYNFVNEYVGTGPNAPGGHTFASITVIALDRYGSVLDKKTLFKDEGGEGDLEGTMGDMATNRVVLTKTEKIVTVKVVLTAKVVAAGNRPRNQTCMSELWLRSLMLTAE